MADDTIRVIRDYIGAPEAEQVSHMRRANEIASATQAVVEAARELVQVSRWSPAVTENRLTGELIDTMPAYNAAIAALAHLDSLTLPPAAQNETLRLDKDGA